MFPTYQRTYSFSLAPSAGHGVREHFVAQKISGLIQLFIKGVPYTRSKWAPGYLMRRLRLEMIMSHFLITTEQSKQSEGLK